MNRRQTVSDFWNSKPPYITSMLLNGHGDSLDLQERPEILKYLPSFKGKTVLDLASGIGRFTSEFAKQAKKVVSLDFCPHFIEENKQANGSFSNIEWICSDVMDAKFQPEQFDLIFISWLFMYLKEEEVTLLSKRLRQWLKPKGVLFFRESCAAVTHFSKTEGYYAFYRSPLDYERVFMNWRPLLGGNIQAYEDMFADPFKCFWIYAKS